MANEAPKKEAPKTEAPKAVEAVKNCAGCNKPLKRAKRFYRNGKYYCNKRCSKKEAPASGQQAAAAAK